MTALLPWISIAVVIVTGFCLIKRMQAHMTLLLSGLVMILLAIAFGKYGFLPKGVKPTGFIGFDIFELLRNITTKQISGIGLIIMTAAGFAGYMDKIGAANALVKVCTAPLKKLSQPYLVLVLGYIIGQVLVSVIPSAAGLAMLLLVALYPILKGVGCSPAASVAVIGTSAGMTFSPTAGTANLAAKTAGLDPIIYLVQYQLKIAVPVLIAVSVAHFFVQRYYDKKNDDVYAESVFASDKVMSIGPAWYAFLPVLPVALLCIFSKLCYTGITLTVVTALFLSWIVGIVIELARLRDARKVFNDAMAMLKGMGSLFASVVALIIAAEIFATGIKLTGLVQLLLASANAGGLGVTGMSTVLSGIIAVVSFLTGSGVGALTSLGSLATDVASGLGGSVTQMISSMQFTAGLARGISPVAGATIVVAAAAGITPVAIIRRTFVPMVGGWIVMMIGNWLLLA
ncbi:MAG: C4-dicarboxylate transporter DcuC [Duodenibacillus sp.]|nr:C4-dicarboxylate transporter DcuC [Duodenibacillus sp.]